MATSPRPTAISSPGPSASERDTAALARRASSGGSSRRRRTSRARISLPEAPADRLLLVVDPLLDLLPGARGADVAQPVAARLGRRAGEDLDRVAALELPVQRRDPAVDLGALALEPDLGVHVEREVDGGGALRQPLHVALGREDEDLVLVEVDLQELEELLGAVRVLLQLEQLAEPAEVLVQLVRRAVALVDPVRRDAVLGGAVHLLGADLHLEQLAARTEDRGVERLVRVRLGAGDVVLDPLLDRRPVVVDDAEHVVAVRHRAHDDPHRHEVVDLVERLAPLLHLLEDRPEVLGPAGDLEPVDARVLQLDSRAGS